MNGNVLNERPEEVRYCYGNLPPSVKEATRRLDEVDEKIASIDGDLRAKTERDLGTPDAYDSWKIRAHRALAHYRREKAFLMQWLSFETGRLEKNQEILSEQERRSRLHQMITEFLRSAPTYGVSISADKSPTLEQVATRRAELTDLKLEYEAFLTFLNGEAFRINCPEQYYYSARAKVVQIVQRAQVEMSHLKKLNKTLSFGVSCFPGRRSYDPYPESCTDPRMVRILTDLHEIKTTIGMNNAKMTVWLYELLSSQKHLLVLTPEQAHMLGLIDTYVQLTKERMSIQFPGQD